MEHVWAQHWLPETLMTAAERELIVATFAQNSVLVPSTKVSKKVVSLAFNPNFIY